MADFIKSLLIDFWNVLADMSPYLLFGFLFAGILSVFISQNFVEKHLGGRGILPILKASFFGVPLPLCSCGVIPVSMSLHKQGASKGSTIAFLLSTPQTGVDSILVTLGLLGPVFAVFRPLAAFTTGIVGGTLVDLFDTNSQNVHQAPQQFTESCCECESKSRRLVRGLKYGFITLPQDIGKAMLGGLIIAAVISAVVPEDFFAEKLGTGFGAMIVMMLLGIPVYVCASASVPMAAAMILKGLTPGAALVFLMTGPATNAASFITIWKTLGRRSAIIYLLSVAGCALAAGWLIDRIGAEIPLKTLSHVHNMLPPVISQICAVILLAILIFAALTKEKEGS
jgi:hypothetical protein